MLAKIEEIKNTQIFKLYPPESNIYDNGVTLTLDDKRSLYYTMLITNIQVFGEPYWLKFKQNYFNLVSSGQSIYINGSYHQPDAVLDYSFIQYIDVNIKTYDRYRKLNDLNLQQNV